MAHHADDQAELFMMRMARGSGIIGLAGMAFISSIFPRKPLLDGTCDLLLIRPLLDLTKHDLYRVCEKAGQEWIEDPTNRKQIFARNCIRQALEEPPFGRSNHLLVLQYQFRLFNNQCHFCLDFEP
jgi:tRNA(Ile)-lysidine synthase